MADVRARFRRSQDDDKYTLPLGAPRMGAAEPFNPSPLTLPEARARASALTRLPRLPGRTNIQQEQLSEQLSTPQVAADVQPVVNGAPQGFRQPAAQVPAPTPRLGFSEDVTAPYTGVGLAGQQVASGPRIIRREGQSPLLTRLTGDRLDAAMLEPQRVGEYESLSDKGFAGVRSLAVPEPPAEPQGVGFRAAVGATPEQTSLNELGTLLSEGARRPRSPRTPEQVLSGFGYTPRTPAGAAAAFRLAADMSNSEVSAANRAANIETGAFNRGLRSRQVGVQEANAAAQEKMATSQMASVITKAKTALGTSFEPYYEETPIDPTNPLMGTTKTLAGYTTKDKLGIPSRIPAGELDAYLEAVAAAKTQKEKDSITARFKQYFMPEG